MHLQRTADGVVVCAPAKLNLFFEVLNRRNDGFHEVETLVYPIDLYDTLILSGRAGPRIDFRLVFASSGAPCGDVPEDSANLVVRALELLRRRAGAELGARVSLRKRIPTAAGLGGGSSDAAAALAAANVVWGLHWPRERLAQVGAELGSDVPLFLHSSASICRGRGEIIVPAPGSPILHLVVVRPPEGLRTADVYRTCRIAGRPRPVRPFAEAFARGDLKRMAETMFNRLETSASLLSPWIARVRRALETVDCVGYQMTGSGSCCFGLCRHARHARRVARRLQTRGIGTVYAVRGCR
ncbi:MAG: 4-(cytidine 5'-diphospho)-2-C-methyl-D-erythritol kinase [Pirellulaceae bacterium]|jgi:4-diphosphocytidyl-2-C-methyl-D-erythritol kinase|nr:4-(cytidine 5'-diphospho)-2-C-methyl-D-erythritol kinase [Pirellulaceae bacterium]